MARFAEVTCLSDNTHPHIHISWFFLTFSIFIVIIGRNLSQCTGTVFTDYGDAFVVNDVTGEEAKTAIVSSVNQAKPGLVTCVEDGRLDFEDGDIVRFAEVRGWSIFFFFFLK